MPRRRLRARHGNRQNIDAFIREHGGRESAIVFLSFIAARISVAGYGLEFMRALIDEFDDELPDYAVIRRHVRELEAQQCHAED